MSQKCSGGAVALWDDTSLRARTVLKGSAIKENTRQGIQSTFNKAKQGTGSRDIRKWVFSGLWTKKLWAGAWGRMFQIAPYLRGSQAIWHTGWGEMSYHSTLDSDSETLYRSACTGLSRKSHLYLRGPQNQIIIIIPKFSLLCLWEKKSFHLYESVHNLDFWVVKSNNKTYMCVFIYICIYIWKCPPYIDESIMRVRTLTQYMSLIPISEYLYIRVDWKAFQ